MASPSASVHYLQSLMQVMAELGLDGRAVLARAGLDTAELEHPDNRVPFDVLLRAWHLAIEESGDPVPGLLGARRFNPAIYGPLASIIVTSPSLGDVAAQLVRFQAIPEDATHADIELQGDEVVLRFDTGDYDPAYIRPVVEYELSEILGIARFLTDPVHHPRLVFNAVSFRHAAPADVALYRELLGATPAFEQAYNEVRFDADLLGLACACPDPDLFQTLLERMEARHNDPDDSLPQRLKQFIVHALPRGVPRIRDAAEHLGMAVRTLQRRLDDEGVTFADSVDAVRHDLACKLMRRKDASITEAAYLLGFTDPSAFHKAFRRWTGQSPGEWRRRAASS
ncbi:MAG: AraC family transcriptional regulator [Alcanivoracaceae bacterium]|nr:AraC family transcriptional regulator [Alcanivoracaceae bacterium]